MFIDDMELHTRALGIARELKSRESALLDVLMEMKQKRAFEELGYRGVFEYVQKALKLSDAQAFYFQKVVQKSFEVPALKKAVVSGELTVSQARRIVPVLNSSNSDEWIGKAREMKQRDLERAVAEVNPASRVREQVRPVAPGLSQLMAGITPEVEALLERVKDLESQRTRGAASVNDTLKASFEVYLDKNDPIRKAERLATPSPNREERGLAVSSRKPKGPSLHGCKNGRKVSIPTLRPGRRRIVAVVTHQVNQRDGGRCTSLQANGRRCEERRWLERDHIVPVVHGGLNTAENLRTLCHFHHRRRHCSQARNLDPIR